MLVRAFSNKASFQDEISYNLGRSFPRAAFVIVLVCTQIKHITWNLLTFLLLSLVLDVYFVPFCVQHGDDAKDYHRWGKELEGWDLGAADPRF